MVSSFLKDYGKQYLARRDEKGTWRIINLYHSSLRDAADPDFDVPDDHPSVTIITEGGFLELMAEVRKLGMVQQLNLEGGDFNVSTEAYDKVKEEKEELEDELEKIKKEGLRDTEEFRLASQKLIVIQDLANSGSLGESIIEVIQRIGGNESVKKA
ncbi:MAG: hypothetical protein AABY07_02895 [Nanoarchaeota archaeon]